MDRGERLNTITHLVGAALALAGVTVLLVFASIQGNPWKIVSFSIYGFSLFSLYLISTLYHGLNGRTKKLFYILDHQAIYLLIAGTYTPFMLVSLNGARGWTLFGIIWGIAIFGFVLDALPSTQKSRRILPVILYVLMGWFGLVALDPLLQSLTETGFLWLLSGGIFYTSGIVFYVLSSRFVYAHGIWHLFVLAGSACHYISILFYIA